MATLALLSTVDLPKDISFGSHRLEKEPGVRTDYLLVWGQQAIEFSALPNLKGVFSLGAGVDHLDLSVWPDGLPLLRLIDPLLTEEMTGFVVMNVLRFHRGDGFYREGQRLRRWQEFLPKPASEVGVGIAGAGVLGKAAAATLRGLGYSVGVWSRTEKSIKGVESFSGQAGFGDFLRRTDILINLLPLTEETAGLWNDKTLGTLKEGAFVINAGRGGSLVEDDLIALLDERHFAGAALDVFQTEPLPKESPLWSHPKILVTPHVASLTHPSSVVIQVLENIERLEQSEEPLGLVDIGRGY